MIERQDVTISRKWKIITVLNSVTHKTMETKKNHLSSTSTSYDMYVNFVTSHKHVMTSHDVNF